MPALTLLLIAATLLLVAACGVDDVGASPDGLGTTTLPSPPEQIYAAAWADPDTLAFLTRTTGPRTERSRQYLFFLDLKTMRFEEFRPVKTEQCRTGALSEIRPLLDGRLGVVMVCDFTHDSHSGSDGTNVVFAVDWKRFEEEVIASYASLGLFPEFAPSPDLSEGLVAEIGGDVTDGLQPNVRLWKRGGGVQGTVFTGWNAVLFPSWSPDGNRYAFAATNDTESDRGPTNWSLFTSSARPTVGLEDAEPLVEHLDYPGPIAWSPDGRRIAFSAEADRTEGIWIVDYPSGTLLRLWPRQAWFSWSPDGTQMLIVDRPDYDDLDARPEPQIVTVPSFPS